ncbi:hypothetical protein K5V21_16090 [Clostridium sardiniense]|uniref:Uncharacterized protein n=1 Tax=Clostridium sardiniense TaxID=29369 RepID=A0ABS7L1L4_CLOSR|nr:hypothetical protein [Clostridium sardiniense]MBY0756942.1 hypothetical protein [Clostridium sardiniense]MBY0756966.1 hypothetical protein [Clostridium sardiniense]MDQ0460361.1 hypothetical protein [Clostridium sardiniense]
MSEALKNLINIYQEETKKCGLLEVLKLEHEVYRKIGELEHRGLGV